MLVFGMNKRIAIADKTVNLFKGHYISLRSRRKVNTQ